MNCFLTLPSPRGGDSLRRFRSATDPRPRCRRLQHSRRNRQHWFLRTGDQHTDRSGLRDHLRTAGASELERRGQRGTASKRQAQSDRDKAPPPDRQQQPVLVTSGITRSADTTTLTETDVKKTPCAIYTLRQEDRGRTRVRIDFFVKNSWTVKMIFTVFLGKNLMSSFRASLENLKRYCEEHHGTERAYPLAVRVGGQPTCARFLPRLRLRRFRLDVVCVRGESLRESHLRQESLIDEDIYRHNCRRARSIPAIALTAYAVPPTVGRHSRQAISCI